MFNSNINSQNNIKVVNSTKYNVEQLIQDIADITLDSVSAIIYVNYIPDNVSRKLDREYTGMVSHKKYSNNTYQILLSKHISKRNLVITLCHEFIHIKQYEKKQLEIFDGYAIFKGIKIYFNIIKYEDREYEKEALFLQYKVLKKLKPKTLISSRR